MDGESGEATKGDVVATANHVMIYATVVEGTVKLALLNTLAALSA